MPPGFFALRLGPGIDGPQSRTPAPEKGMFSTFTAGYRHRMRAETDGGERVLAAALEGDEGAAETLEHFGDDLLLGDVDRRIGRALCDLDEAGSPMSALTLLLELGRAGDLDGRVLERVGQLVNGRTRGGAALGELDQMSERTRDFLRERGRNSGEHAREGPRGADSDRGRAEGEEAELVFLRDILDNPELYEPPATVVDRMAWKGRVSLLAGREKLGKSTLVSAAAAAASNGEPLFDVEPDRQGYVLYFGLEEALADAAGRLVRCGADPDRLVFAEPQHVAPFERLERCVEVLAPALVVVDSLAAFTQQLDLEPGNSAHWTRVMSRFTNLARAKDAALVLVHHARKRDGRYRDSTAIGAGVDMILEMSRGDAENEREISARGRWALEDYSFVLEESEGRLGYRLTDDGEPLEARVVRWVRRNPGCSSRGVREAVRGKADEVAGTLRQLEDAGRLENRGDGSRHEWHVKAGI